MNKEDFQEACECLYLNEDKVKDLSDDAKSLVTFIGCHCCPYGVSHKTLLEHGSEETIAELLNKKVIVFKDGFYY